MSATWAGASVCQSCKRMVRHKPRGGPHRRHGCRIRWIARRIARARSEGWDDGYRFALDNVSDPLVYADLTEYGTGWAEQIGMAVKDTAERIALAIERRRLARRRRWLRSGRWSARDEAVWSQAMWDAARIARKQAR